MTKIAVSGATGNLGGLAIDNLVSLGVAPDNIVPLVRSEDKAAAFFTRGMKPRIADYDDAVGFERALEGIDKLVLISPPVLDNAKRLHQMHGAVMAAHSVGLTQLALVSLADPEERPFALEDVDIAIEHSVRAVGIPFTILRNSVYLDELGPELAVAAKSGELVSATGNHTMNWAPRADQASAIAASVVRDGHIGATYNLVSPEPYTYDNIAEMLGRATGRAVSHRQAQPAEAMRKLVAGGLSSENAESVVGLFQKAIANGKCRTTGNDIERLSGRPGRPTVEYLAAIANRSAEQAA